MNRNNLMKTNHCGWVLHISGQQRVALVNLLFLRHYVMQVGVVLWLLGCGKHFGSGKIYSAFDNHLFCRSYFIAVIMLSVFAVMEFSELSEG